MGIRPFPSTIRCACKWSELNSCCTGSGSMTQRLPGEPQSCLRGMQMTQCWAVEHHPSPLLLLCWSCSKVNQSQRQLLEGCRPEELVDAETKHRNCVQATRAHSIVSTSLPAPCLNTPLSAFGDKRYLSVIKVYMT